MMYVLGGNLHELPAHDVLSRWLVLSRVRFNSAELETSALELPTLVRGVSAKRTPQTDSTIANINAI